MKNQKKEKLPFIIRIIVLAIQLVFIILFIVFTLLTLGIFLPDDKEKRKKKSGKPTASKEEWLLVNIERKQNRVRTIQERIGELEEIVSVIKRKERRMLFFARLVIVCFLVGANLVYLDCLEIDIIQIQWKKNTIDYIEIITNFNAFVLLMYGIPAFLFYGTVGKFTTAMKAKSLQILKRKHIPTFSELQSLREEQKLLKQEILALELRLLELRAS